MQNDKWIFEDEGQPEYLDGSESQFTIRRDGGGPVAYALKEDEARLIAAAPELLKATIVLSELLRAFTGPDDAMANAAFAISDAAILKATVTP